MNDETNLTPEELARLEAERQAREGEASQQETSVEAVVTNGAVAG